MKTSPPSSVALDGIHSHLIEDEQHRRTDVEVSQVRLHPRGSGPHRLATICLATLCALMLMPMVNAAAQGRNKPQEDGAVAPELQKKPQEMDMATLTATISRLLLEKKQLQLQLVGLQDQINELLAQLATMMPTKAPKEIERTEPVPAPPAIVCPRGWHLFDASCYLISSLQKNWDESRKYCEVQGAHLAIIHSAEEQTFLWDLLPRGHWNAFWFGITDQETEDQWKWVDGSPLVGGFWEAGEPNNHQNEDCGYMIKTEVLERVAVRSWYDAPCHMALPHICEKEMGAA